MSITPKNWTSFQHYKDRSPPWIKLHHALLDNFDFHCLPVASRALAPCIWLLASEFEGGKITLASRALAFRLHCSEIELAGAIKPLIDGGFIVDDSNMLAECYQSASPEERRGETEAETEEREKGKTPQMGFSSFPEEERRGEAEAEETEKGNGSARALASALPSGALACAPSSEPTSPKQYTKLTDQEANDYRSPPRTKPDTPLQPLPEKLR